MHQAKLLVIHCIDLRFQEAIDEDVKKQVKYGEFDRIAWPGASIDFENVKKAADISLRLHKPNQVIIYEHEDCGAYGEDNAFETHKKNAQKLMEALIEVNPALNVSTKIATFEGVKEL
ncbi:MAG: hypothetical protein UT84_C0003G0101 [Candidatus Curtissbacteria bacterium GW2011_GWA1_40_16]|uniref:Carbonic anhydrase n=1 Tax=Candidatus Curtissbacteria bacterium GW2011_GWA1_40_16 TaxID=1618405 RepID=A0A0G0RML8_9BACT|nr:MAG: hypothetical protein UT84_C0003G0101 [Candidatus Curtissbacteria bacterium GW2011_GWA1_40_16]